MLTVFIAAGLRQIVANKNPDTRPIAPRPSLCSALSHEEKNSKQISHYQQVPWGKQTLLSLVRNLVCGRTSVKTVLKPLFIVCFEQIDPMILCLNKVLQGWIGKASFFLLILCSCLDKHPKKSIFFLNLLLCNCTSESVNVV